MAPIMNSKDNILIWSGVYLPRIMCTSTLFMLNFTPLSATSQYRVPSFYPTFSCFVINLAAIVLWADWRLPGKLFGMSYKLESLNKLVLAASLVSSGFLLLEIIKPEVVCSQLCAVMLVVTLLWEYAHVYLVPGDMKYSQNNKISQSFYILSVFVADFVFLCFLAHIFTRGVLIPWQKEYFKMK